MGHHHHHHHASEPSKSNQNLFIATFLNLIITFAQIIGGIISNSLSLLSDALHNLSDSVALAIAWWAQKISRKPSTPNKTFGFQRVEILAAFVNSGILFVICLYLVYQAINRFFHPEEIKGILMLVVATIGLLANLISVFILRKDKTTSLNIKAAYLHLMGDTLSSVAVIAGGILILKFNWFWIDPLVTIIIAIYIAYESIHILKDTTSILMQSVPEHVVIDEIRVHLLEIEEIKDIHHIHVWGLNESSFFLELHVNLKDDILISQTADIQQRIESIARHHFEIKHVTVQFEFDCCNDKNDNCYCGKK